VVAGVLGVKDILVDDERGAAGLWRVADTDLPDRTVLSEYVVPENPIFRSNK
jgi:hypothetical protein